MPDCSSGEIQIGGDVPRSLVEKLLELLSEEGAIDAPEESELPAPDTDGVLSFENNEAPGGAFYALEEFLEENGIDFDRQSSPSYYYDPEDICVRKGIKWTSSRDAMDALRRRISKEMLKGGWSKLSHEDLMNEVRLFAKRNGPPPKLRPFRIVEGE